MQAGDVYQTYACIDKLHSIIDFRPKFNLDKGLRNFIEWFKVYEKDN